jgi:N-acetylmuramoyl-L-alanine amidase
MKLNISAGHGPDGKVGCGAVGLIKESTEARVIKDKVLNYLRKAGHTAYDCTVNNGTSQNDILQKIVKKCNEHQVDVDVSIHFNSGAKDKKGNGKSTGVEVLVYSKNSKAYDEATRICSKLSAIGFKNRGVKVRTDLYVLKNTNAAALLIEVCFVDDKDDVDIYKKNVDNIAKAIAEALINKPITEKVQVELPKKKETSYLVRITADVLKIRKGAGVEYGTNGSVKKGQVFTIVDEKWNGKTKWGKLKSGQGFISLKYTEKVVPKK